MKKKILIIANPGESGTENYCEGVLKDVENYKKYFMSPVGGSWYSSEIECLKTPNKYSVSTKLNEMKYLDFSIIIFTGHGYSQNEETFVELNSEEGMSVTAFKENGKKRLVIVDCCRKEWFPVSELNEAYFFHREKSFFELKNTREIYEDYIRAADVMNIVMYGCDLGETSGDDSKKGGFYSSSLLKICTEFAETNKELKKYCLTAPLAHERAKVLVKRLKIDQNPQIEKPRMGKYLPIAVTEF